VSLTLLSTAGPACCDEPGPAAPNPEDLALAFLCREVPRWSRENHCFSCHNNGDAARALYAGDRIGLAISRQAIADTTVWLTQPDRWEHNGGDGPFSDKRLARLQFSLALTAARRAGHVKDLQVVVRAAGRLSQDQAADGSWPLEGENEPGSPTAYGQFLATYLAREVLSSADPARFKPAIDRASRWLLDHNVSTVSDAAVMLMATAPLSSARAAALGERSVSLLRKAQSDEGGWGPFVTSPPEAFDTALVLIALARAGDPVEQRDLIARGRSFLIAQQQPDGSWIETTRPRGGESYAQRVSTTGWAALALLALRESSSPSRLDAKRP
jgi:hypothetical protein